ncbi:hypothetical protein SESBI_22269 [Sesbania bispinosa]|nr:hypothetical protein SESBI_22269 [Sesbania bispinosa]
MELTPLNAKRSQILREVYNLDLLEMPPPGKGLRGPFKDRWCAFHRLKGHDTEECWDLMNQIEHLIKDGYLKRYVAGKNRADYVRQRGRGRGRGYPPQDKNKENHAEQETEIRGTVTTISGGFIGGGSTSSARKKYSRSVMQVNTVTEDELIHPNHPPITFSNDDFKGITPHEHDPMVIEVTMAAHKVQRVLVDQGSSADIMYWSTFKRLGLAQELLLPFAGALVGFAGDSVEFAYQKRRMGRVCRRCSPQSFLCRVRPAGRPQGGQKASTYR